MNNIEILSKCEELSNAELDGVNGGFTLKQFKEDLAVLAAVVVYVAKKVDSLLK